MTATTKYTPGPWQAEKYPALDMDGKFARHVSASGVVVATVGGHMDTAFSADPDDPKGIERANANSILIAAAPDLLEAAKDYLSPGGNQRLKRAALVAAIAKAEGGAR